MDDVFDLMAATSASTPLVKSGSVINVIVCTAVRDVAVIIALTADLVIGVLNLQDRILDRFCVKTVGTT